MDSVAAAHGLGSGTCRQETRAKALAFFPKIGLSDNGHGVLRILPPWRLVLLEGGVASAASYPAWPVAETSRPKVLVFFCVCGDVVG